MTLPSSLFRAGLLVAGLCCSTGPVDASETRAADSLLVRLDTVSAEAPKGFVEILVGESRQQTTFEVGSLEGVTFRDLPAGEPLEIRVTTESETWWAEPTAWHGEPQVEILLYPAGTISLVPIADEPNSSPRIRLDPIRSDTPAVDLDCVAGRISETFDCRAPAGHHDLRIAIDGHVPIYEWDRRLEAGQTLELGELRFRRGASLSGWVSVPARMNPAEVEIVAEPRVSSRASGALDRKRLSSRTISTKTDERGFFQLAGLSPGTWDLTARRADLATARREGFEITRSGESQGPPLVLSRPPSLAFLLDPAVDAGGLPWTLRLSRQPSRSRVDELVVEKAADLDGSWRQTISRPGTHRLEIVDSTGSTWHQEILEITASEERFLEISAIPIAGLVTMGDDEPLAGVKLAFGGLHRRPRIFFTTDGEGEFAGLLPRDGSWDLDVERPDGTFQSLPAIDVRADEPVEVRLPNTRLTGKVSHRQRPAAGAFVLVHDDGPDGHRLANGVTDEEGRFDLAGLPEGPVRIMAYVDAGHPASEWRSVELAEEYDAEVELVVREDREIRGRLLAGGHPVAGAFLAAAPGPGSIPQRSLETTTNVEGRFTFAIEPDLSSLDLLVVAPGLGIETKRLRVGEGEILLEIPAERGENLHLVDLPWPWQALSLRHRGVSLPLEFVWRSLQEAGRANATGPEGLSLHQLAGHWELCSPRLERCLEPSFGADGLEIRWPLAEEDREEDARPTTRDTFWKLGTITPEGRLRARRVFD